MQNRGWIIHIEWIIGLATLISVFYFLNQKIERQEERIDRLYEMFFDVLKRSQENKNPNLRNFYENFNEIKKNIDEAESHMQKIDPFYKWRKFDVMFEDVRRKEQEAKIKWKNLIEEKTKDGSDN